MQHVRSIAAGLLVLVASAAGADELPIVKETQAYWRGCTYKLKVLDDSIAGSQSWDGAKGTADLSPAEATTTEVEVAVWAGATK